MARRKTEPKSPERIIDRVKRESPWMLPGYALGFNAGIEAAAKEAETEGEHQVASAIRALRVPG